MSDEANQQINREERSETSELKWLTRHEVGDENVDDGAEHLDRNIGECQTDEIGSDRIPSIEMLALYDWQL